MDHDLRSDRVSGSGSDIFTGILQVTGGVLVLIPRTFAIGIPLLMSSMAGAMAAWIFVLGVPLAAIIPGSIFAGLLFVGAEDVFDLMSRRHSLLRVSLRGCFGSRILGNRQVRLTEVDWEVQILGQVIV